MARHPEDAFKTSWRRLEEVFARRLEDLLQTSGKCLEGVRLRRIYWSWPRLLEDVFWRRKAKSNIFVLIKTSSEDEDERRLQDVFIKTNVCWPCVDSSWKQYINWEYPHILAQETVHEDLRKLKMFMNIVNFSLIIFEPKMFRYPETKST